MKKEELLKDLITEKYGSVLKFSEQSGIPYSTLRNIFFRGFDGIAVATAIRICNTLQIDLESFMKGELQVRPNPQKDEAWSMYVQAVDTPKEQKQNKLLDAFAEATNDERREMLERMMQAITERK
jgi:hypothetical protein